MSSRWNSAFFCSGDDFGRFWSELGQAKDRNAVLVTARSADHRAPMVAELLMTAGFPIRHVYILQPWNHESPLSDDAKRAMDENDERFSLAFGGLEPEAIEIDRFNQEGRAVGGMQITVKLGDTSTLEHFSDVIIDVTAIPRSMYFPLLKQYLTYFDDRGDRNVQVSRGNLHVVGCESPGAAPAAEGGMEAEVMYGFGGNLQYESGSDRTKIWIPVLGEGRGASLDKLYNAVMPHETIPVVPFPSMDPKRGDRIVREYRTQLFQTWTVPPSDFIYASESNPIDLYRQIVRLADDYREVLTHLGDITIVLSPESSKVLSLGVLLAAYEKGLTVMHVEPTGYSLSGHSSSAGADTLFEVWLAGEPYDT